MKFACQNGFGSISAVVQKRIQLYILLEYACDMVQYSLSASCACACACANSFYPSNRHFERFHLILFVHITNEIFDQMTMMQIDFKNWIYIKFYAQFFLLLYLIKKVWQTLVKSIHNDDFNVAPVEKH